MAKKKIINNQRGYYLSPSKYVQGNRDANEYVFISDAAKDLKIAQEVLVEMLQRGMMRYVSGCGGLYIAKDSLEKYKNKYANSRFNRRPITIDNVNI